MLGLVAALAVAGLFPADSLGMLPWVQSLLVKGLGAGSAMILLIASVSTNVSTLGAVAQVMGRRTAVLYAESIVALAAACGAGLNWMLMGRSCPAGAARLVPRSVAWLLAQAWRARASRASGSGRQPDAGPRCTGSTSHGVAAQAGSSLGRSACTS